jgi:hypothetical protein
VECPNLFDRARSIFHPLGSSRRRNRSSSSLFEQDHGVGLFVPLRVFVYEDKDGKTYVSYNKASSLLKQFNNQEIDMVADPQNPFTVIGFEATLACPLVAGQSISVDRRHAARGLNLFPRLGSPMVRES